MKMWECGGCNGDETHKCVARVTHLVSWWRLDGCMLCCSLHVARVSWLLYHWPRFAIIRTHLTVIEAIRQNMNLVVELACAFQQQTSCIAITVLTHYFILAMPLIIAEVKWDNVWAYARHGNVSYRIGSHQIAADSTKMAVKPIYCNFTWSDVGNRVLVYRTHKHGLALPIILVWMMRCDEFGLFLHFRTFSIKTGSICHEQPNNKHWTFLAGPEAIHRV